MAEIVNPALGCLFKSGDVPFLIGQLEQRGGYVHHVPFHKVYSLSSLMFIALARRCDLLVIEGEYFHNTPQSILMKYINAVGEARSHGCRIIIVGLDNNKLHEELRDSALAYLREFSKIVGNIDSAIDIALEYVSTKRREAEYLAATAVESGRHVREPMKNGKDEVAFKIGHVSYKFPVMSGLAVPNPFDVQDESDKYRYIIGHTDNYVAVCSMTNEDSLPRQSGYVVHESHLGLKEGWRDRWKSSVLFSGATVVHRDDWNFVVLTDNVVADLKIIGGVDYKINGKCVVQRVPYCLPVLVDESELKTGG